MATHTLRFVFEIASPPIYRSTHPVAIAHALDVQKAIDQLRDHTENEYGKTVTTLEPVNRSAKQKATHPSQRLTCDITYPNGQESSSILSDLCTFGVRNFRVCGFFCDTGSGMGELVYLSRAHAEALDEVRESLIHGLSGADRTAFTSAVNACNRGEVLHHLGSDVQHDLASFKKRMTKRGRHGLTLQAGKCEIQIQQDHWANEQAEFLEQSQALIQACAEKLEAFEARLDQLGDTSVLGGDQCLSADAAQEAEQVWRGLEKALSELKAELASRRGKLERQNRVALAQNVTIYQLEREKVMEEHDQKERNERLRLLVCNALLCLPLCLFIVYCGAQVLISLGLL